MKLPNFREHPGLNRLRFAMRARYVALDWKLVGWDPFDKNRIRDALKYGRDVVVDPSVLDVGTDGTIAVSGERVLIYIRDAYNPKFHIAHCGTLKGMIGGGRGHRYVVSTRTDGIFQLYAGRKKIERRLDVCINCLNKLRRTSFPNHALFTYYRFNLAEFFDLYKQSPAGWRPVYTNETAPSGNNRTAGWNVSIGSDFD